MEEKREQQSLLIYACGIVLFCGLLFLRRSHAQAEGEDATQRAQLIEAINNELVTIAAQLDAIKDKDSDDPIQVAIRQTEGMRQNISHLGDVKGDDGTANSIVDHYPDYIESFVESANALAKLKNAQLLQSQKNLSKLCADENENLKNQVKKYLEPPDPSGADKISESANKTKDRLHDDLAKQVNQESEINSAYGQAKAFSVSEGGWSDVSSKLRDGAESIWGMYQPRLSEIKQNCSDLDKGADNPFIVESLAKLTGASASSKQTLDDILKDWEAWKERRRDLAAKYVFNADKIRMAICDGDNEQIQGRVEEAEAAAQKDLKDPYRTLDDQLYDLIQRVHTLETDTSVGAEARKWQGVMKGAQGRLEKIINDGDIMHGVENAKVRARIQIGIDKHAQMQTGCTAYEYQIPGDGRIDCLNVSDDSCDVIEFKPDNEKAQSRGFSQLDGYKEAIEELQSENKLPALLERCIKDGELHIEYKLKTYEFCPVPNEDIDAMLREQEKQSTSTADEAP